MIATRKHCFVRGLCAAALLTGPFTTSHAKPAAKPAPSKPAAKPAQKPVETAKGMVQLAGDDGKLGTTYTLGKDNPINFTLNSAEFTVARVNISDTFYAPKADEKLLLLNYTIHNPNKEIRNYNWSTLLFTVVDAASENHEYVQAVGRGTSEGLDIELKPAQKIEAFTVVVVPAKGVMPKLIVTPNTGSVLRYDLRGVVKPLAAPFADAADAAGSTARSEVVAEAGKFFPAQAFDINLGETSYTDGPLGDHEKEEGKRFFVAKVTIRNATTTPQSYNWSTLAPVLTASDDEKADWNQVFFKTARNEDATGELKPGEEYTGRIFFQLPADVTAKTLTLTEGESRTYSFDVSGTK